jgi:hypothetical protein
MTEFFFILVQFFIIYFLLSFNLCILNYKNLKIHNLTLPENISFNFIIFLNFILVVSFFNLNLNKIILCYSLYLFFLIILYLYRYKTLFITAKNNFFYFILLFTTSLVIFLEVSNNLIIGWDAQKFWIYKTLNFYNGNTITNLSNLPNPWYPYLGSLSWSFFWKVSFLENEYSGRLLYVFVYLSSLLLLISNFNFSRFNKIIFFILLIIISYDYTYHSHWSIFSGYQEILIFSLVTMTMHFLYRLSKTNTKTENINILSVLLICNLLVWIKHEGLIISFSLILTLIFFFKLHLRKKFAIFAIFFGIIFFRFFIFDFYSLNPNNIQHQGFEYFQFKEIIAKISLERILLIFKYLLMNLFSNYLILIGIFLLSFSLITKKKLKKLFYIIFFAVFNILIFCGIYLITDLNLDFMLKTSMDRIIYQISPFAILIFLELYNSKNLS